MHSLLVLITQELASIRQQLGPESELLLQGVSYKQESGIDILVRLPILSAHTVEVDRTKFQKTVENVLYRACF